MIFKDPGEVYLIQHYVIKWFSLGTPVSATNRADRHDKTEVLLKVALNTIKQQTNQSKILLVLGKLYGIVLMCRVHDYDIVIKIIIDISTNLFK